MAQTLKNHVALITGSTTGLGFGIAKVLGLAGSKIIMNYYNDQERANRAYSDLEAMGCEVTLVRGNAIDETALVKHLKRNKDFFVYLDVFKNEPLKSSNKLWSLSNVSITPHVAGVTAIDSAVEYMFQKYQIYINNHKLKSDVKTNKSFY